MTYREHPAPAPLRGLAECAWSNGFSGPTEFDVLPDGCMDLVWTGVELLVAGPDTAPHRFCQPSGRQVAGLRFGPGRLPALLAVPAVTLRDQRVPLAELHPGPARWATARLLAGSAPGQVLRDLTLALPGALPEPGLGAVAAILRRGRSAAETADALGWTTRSLHRRCLASFGYGPSVLRRVLRFRGALALLRAGVPTAEVAARTGYADQPHMSREVRALAGTSPGQLAGTAAAVLTDPAATRAAGSGYA